MRADKQPTVKRRGASDGLIVFLHGWQDDPDGMKQLDAAAADRLPHHDSWAPDLPIKTFFSRTRVAEVANALLEELDEIVQDKSNSKDYNSIVIVGHSLGAALARSLWSRAHGAQDDGTIVESAEKVWARRINRLILLAGVNRGWDPQVPVNAGNRLKMWLADIVENTTDARFLMLDIRRGAPFLTVMRLQMLTVLQCLAKRGEAGPVIVHILGEYDNVVAPTDNFDRATRTTTEFYLEVPDTGHEAVLDLTAPPRRQAFHLAMIGDADELREAALSEAGIQDLLQESNVATAFSPTPTDVVFIVHGIRDYGYWTRRLAIRVKQEARERRLELVTVAATYGFFPIGLFLLPAEQRKRVGWFMDQYVAARAASGPDTRFHFVGHSNGTYLLARALETCAAVKFDRVIFGGSMVSRRYDWSARLAAGQVRQVLNYVASNDLVVASMPAGLQAYGSDIGSAGHTGFDSIDVQQVRFVDGGHSASVAPKRWPEMARFLFDGMHPETGMPPGLVNKQTLSARALNAIAWVLPLAAIMVSMGIGVAFLLPLRSFVAAAWALGFFAYVRTLTRIVNRL